MWYHLIELVSRTTTGTKRTYRPIRSISIAKQQHLGWYSIGTTKSQKLTVDKGASGARKFEGPPGRSTPGASKYNKQDFVPTHCKGCKPATGLPSSQHQIDQEMSLSWSHPTTLASRTPHSILESSRKSQAGHHPSHLLEHDAMIMNHVL